MGKGPKPLIRSRRQAERRRRGPWPTGATPLRRRQSMPAVSARPASFGSGPVGRATPRARISGPWPCSARVPCARPRSPPCSGRRRRRWGRPEFAGGGAYLVRATPALMRIRSTHVSHGRNTRSAARGQDPSSSVAIPSPTGAQRTGPNGTPRWAGGPGSAGCALPFAHLGHVGAGLPEVDVVVGAVLGLGPHVEVLQVAGHGLRPSDPRQPG